MARMVGVILTAPVFSRKEVFPMGKIMICFWTASLLIFVIPVSKELPTTSIQYLFTLVTEITIGAMIGFVLDLFVTGIEFAGSLMDTQAGLSVASLLDPSSGRNITLMSLLLKWVAFMLFLAIDGHHLVLATLVQSFKIIPVGGHANLSAGAYELMKLGSYILYLGVQLSAPILLVVFLIDFGFGMLNKVAEQINIFQLGFQVKPSISLLIFLAVAPSIVNSIYTILDFITNHLLRLFQALQSPLG
jgi:flagellar biosynthetic protein FliR